MRLDPCVCVCVSGKGKGGGEERKCVCVCVCACACVCYSVLLVHTTQPPSGRTTHVVARHSSHQIELVDDRTVLQGVALSVHDQQVKDQLHLITEKATTTSSGALFQYPTT